MSRRVRPAALLALASFAACGVSVVQRGEVDLRHAERIREGVETVRGLAFRKPVPMKVKTPDQLRRYLRKELDRQYTPKELANLQSVYAALGLLPAGTDLGDAVLRLYTAQVAGFYDPRAETLFLVHPSEASGGWLLTLLELVLRRDLVGEMLLAHELTHALQDQHFSILGLADDLGDEDRALAAGAVIEGDATLAGFAYVLGGLPERALLPLVDRLQTIPADVAAALPETPAVLRDALVFRYTDGARFVSWAYLRGGWEAVDAVLASPPRSSEQILWPEKYYITPDDPVEVTLGGLAGYRADPAWSLLEENTLGELMIRILMRGFFSPDQAEWVARGWDGDRYAAWMRGDEIHVYWMSTWDSPRDAKDFFRAEKEILARRFGPSPATVEAGSGEENSFRFEGDTPYSIERRDGRVLVSIGVPPGEAGPTTERVWVETTFRPVSPGLDVNVAANGLRPATEARPAQVAR